MYIVIDTRASDLPALESRIWRHLWEMRDAAPVSVVLPTVVSSPCPLLAEESADAILAAGIQVPKNSAWIPLYVDVSAYIADNGDVHLGALRRALVSCVNRGDAMHDSRGWPSHAVQLDSFLNRRLAVTVRGWGNLVRRRGANPALLQTLSDVEALADFISTTLCTQSRILARQKGHCPALDVAGEKVLASGDEMKSRWQRAVASTALRHRNLLTMSVWDIFPNNEPADFRYVNLLPVLRHANCLSFRRDVDVSHWSVSQYRRFHEHVSAILRSGIDARRIAKQV